MYGLDTLAKINADAAKQPARKPVHPEVLAVLRRNVGLPVKAEGK